MQFFKSSLLFCLLFLFSLSLMAFYSEQECLNKDFDLKIIHKGQPMGLTANVLNLSKNNCVIHISSQKMKYIKNKWIVDVCREPVHIKKDSGSIEILKKNGVVCSESEKKLEYCHEYFKIINTVQDYGLIFAEGEKEELISDHGKVYCVYDLVKKYLFSGLVLTRQNITETPAEKTTGIDKSEEIKSPTGIATSEIISN